jgi:acetyl-CoA acetyltransferase|tara:strand:+ start:1974 stop:3167 length:1194 start_codon:yes stop_codon:yes gene_type:complete
MKLPKTIASLADKTAIVGIGTTEYTRRGGITDRTEFQLCCEAIEDAAKDAGIPVTEIDGFCSYTGERHEPVLVQVALGLPEMRYSNMVWGAGGGGCSGSVMNAALAVHGGICKYAVAYRSLCQGQYERYGQYRPRPMGGSYMAPYGLMSPGQMTALTFRRHMHLYDTPVEALGHIAVTFREHALRNPRAIQYGKPLDLKQHSTSRMIADPFRLFDCCLESDGAAAVIVTTQERARDTRFHPARIVAAAQASGPGWGIGPMGSHNMPIKDYHTTNSRAVSGHLFEMAGMGPNELDCAQIYDAFTGLVLMALEDYGICPPGEAAKFVMEGNLSWQRAGKLPCNTAGGLLSEAYLQGFNLILEAVRQIRGTSTAQVTDARTCLVTSGGGQGHKSALILAS